MIDLDSCGLAEIQNVGLVFSEQILSTEKNRQTVVGGGSNNCSFVF